ncbi:ABC transporter substrate-binding protein [Bacillus sp. DTU_2020_1000418_1_SI_GHA_SEK_038]|uniref:ABC transporter substrate-binding protein n=1 Tax=Bacillus sp. DTU_2020_1000418_1_SI_GHA_SEK_038 TaxID=3077585 RepID=UPI0028EC088A|nr:ABC transporter substrate-binding protein [Bacillus sp. DTU_2020_1000418_1_SI_GHA_SEK_038]WNS75456.1 ABC transporter substrate-binding protein [Bacillus sp. DTU_2020_1000418_1_SI_GHA_SEK_038]
MKKRFGLVSLTLATASILAACGGGGETTKEKPTSLVISTFGLEQDKMEEDVFKPFEEKYNVDIVLETGTSSERFTKLKSNPNSTVDVIELSQSNAADGVTEGLFEKIDNSKVPNMEKLIDSAKGLSADGSGPAYTLNSIGIIYNKKAAGMEIKEWDDLWNSALKGKISIPDITSTFGPAMLYVASKHENADITKDNGKAAFKAITDLSPNVVKTYSKSSDLANMFQSGEIVAAVVGDFAVPMITQANPDVAYIVPESGTFANFNTMNINKNSKNKDLAYKYIDWRLSKEIQEKTAKSLNEAPTNKEVVLDEETAKNKTYGAIADRTNKVDSQFVNNNLEDWINQWNRILNK